MLPWDRADALLLAGDYRATFWIGGLDHLTVSKSDPVRGLCFQISLSSPGTTSALPLSLPAAWRADAAWVLQAPGGCDADAGAAPRTFATGGSGSVAWTGAFPCTIDVDVTLLFSPAAAGVPPQEVLRVQGLAAEGAC